jgi:hypothetical protein
MLINTASLLILKFAVHFTITLIIVNAYVLKICKKLVKRASVRGFLCTYLLQFHDPMFVKYVTFNVILLLMNCSTILIYFPLYACHQAARPLSAHSEPFQYKVAAIKWQLSFIECSPKYISVFNKKVVFIPLKKYMILNLSVLNSGGPYHSVPFRVAPQ